ncbi:hypothetical protein QJS83_14795 [Bdellovibrio sp. 22V]|uniref:hypothetical protein n=1 Tax=Bdellovibrio sp. 22V TaxID=3044166 RepID=UPI0025436DA9|nr:hypothetical protein [Bdellovibrio sp. 22V]WII71731.1 hypothetical protein QJS83_14795 [Bdellovibrio sp. 22V]
MTEKKATASKAKGKKDAVTVTETAGVETVDAGVVDGAIAAPVAAPKPITERRQRQIDGEIAIATTGAEATYDIIASLANDARTQLELLTHDAGEGEVQPEPTVEDFDNLAENASIALKQAKVSARSLKTFLRAGHNAPAIAGFVTEADKLIAEISDVMHKAKALATSARAADREANKAAAAERRAASRAPKVNGVGKPADGSICGNVWLLIEAIGAALGQHAPVAYVLSEGLARGYDANTLKTQYARWKKYHGLDGEIKLPLPPLDIDVPHAPAKADAEVVEDGQDDDVDALLAAKSVQPWDADTSAE